MMASEIPGEGDFRFDTRKTSKVIEPVLANAIDLKITAGLNPALPAVALLLSNKDPDVRRNYMLGLRSPNGRQANSDEVDRAIALVEGRDFQAKPRGGNRRCRKRPQSAFPNPKIFTREDTRLVHESLGLIDLFDVFNICSALKYDSPNGTGHTAREFIADAYYKASPPYIYIGSLYYGVILEVSEITAEEDLIPRMGYDQCLCNPMQRKLTEDERTNGNNKSGGRSNKFASKKLESITIESDTLTLKRQVKVIQFLRTYLPLCYIVHSGKKSLHATFSLKGVPDQDVHKVRDAFSALGADPSVLKPTQLTRLGGAIRSNGNEQKVLYMDRKGRHTKPDLALVRELCCVVMGAAQGRSIVESLLRNGEKFVFDTVSGRGFFPSDLDDITKPSLEDMDDYNTGKNASHEG